MSDCPGAAVDYLSSFSKFRSVMRICKYILHRKNCNSSVWESGGVITIFWRREPETLLRTPRNALHLRGYGLLLMVSLTSIISCPWTMHPHWLYSKPSKRLRRERTPFVKLDQAGSSYRHLLLIYSPDNFRIVHLKILASNVMTPLCNLLV